MEGETLSSRQSSTDGLNPIELELVDRLENDSQFRDRYFGRWASNELATELRAMRKRRKLRQSQLAIAAHTGQSAISRIEQQDYDGWTYKTLLNIANALKARIRFRLEALEDVVKQHSQQDITEGTPLSEIVDGGNTAGDADVSKGGPTFNGSFDIDKNGSGTSLVM